MSEKKEQETVTTSASSNAPSKWGSNSVFPINLKISDDFDNDERTAISQMAQSWEDGIENELNFFTTTASTSDKSNSVPNLDTLWDTEQGVYKSATWHEDLPSSALAVTQIFGTRRNAGESSEYIEILHADILVNYFDFNFSTDGGVGYDLQTVVLHEMGHFLGLGHQSNPAIDSIMYPSISSADSIRTPYNYDVEKISERYGLTSSVGSTAIRRGLAGVYKIPEKDEVLKSGNAVKITLELHANGNCLHKIDGVIKKSHHHNIKSKLK